MHIVPLGLDHVVLRISDLNRSLVFYRDILGCVVDRRREGLGLYHLRAGAAQIDLVTLRGELGKKGGGPPIAEGPNMDHFCLRLETFDGRPRVYDVVGLRVDAEPLKHGDILGKVLVGLGAPENTPSDVGVKGLDADLYVCQSALCQPLHDVKVKEIRGA